MHIYAGYVVNHLWKVIEKAHILSEDLRGILRTTGALNIPLLWSLILGPENRLLCLLSSVHSINQTQGIFSIAFYNPQPR